MSPLADAYRHRANDLLAAAWENNAPVIARVAPVLGGVVARGGVIHTFGSGHSELISREIIGRAGGLVCVTGIIDPTGGFVENLHPERQCLIGADDVAALAARRDGARFFTRQKICDIARRRKAG